MVSYLSMVSRLDKNKGNQNKNKNKVGNGNNNNNNTSYNNNNNNNTSYNNNNNKQELSSTSSSSSSSTNPKSLRSYSDLICSICKSNQIITDPDSGELICSNCGQVISNKVEQEGPEW